MGVRDGQSSEIDSFLSPQSWRVMGYFYEKTCRGEFDFKSPFVITGKILMDRQP
jgi:hypothetical protein